MYYPPIKDFTKLIQKIGIELLFSKFSVYYVAINFKTLFFASCIYQLSTIDLNNTIKMPFFTPQKEQTTSSTNINGLFSHSKAEALLQRICNKVEKHEIEITTLRCDIDSSHDQIRSEMNSIQEKISNMNSKIDELHERVESIEQSIRIPGSSPSSKLLVGEAVLANRRTLARTLNLVSQKADSDAVKESIESQSNALKESMEEWKRDLASNDAVQKSNDAMSALVTRVDTMADDMCNKVDKSLFKTISSDATCIKNYASFFRSTEETTKKLEADIQDIGSTLVTYDNKLQIFEDQVQTIETGLSKCPTIDEFVEVTTNIQSLNEQLLVKADESIMVQLKQETIQSGTQLSLVECDVKTLFAAHETLAKYMTKRLDKMYNNTSIDDKLSKYVKSDELEANLQHVTTIIDTKACKESLSQLQQSIHDLESDLSITKRKADLSAQFVGWYGKEGNDKHIQQLHADNMFENKRWKEK